MKAAKTVPRQPPPPPIWVPPEDYRGEDRDDKIAANERISGGSLSAEDHASGTVKKARHHVAEELRARHGDAARTRGSFVAPDSIERGAERAVLDGRPDKKSKKDRRERSWKRTGDQITREESGQALRHMAAGIGHDQKAETQNDKHAG